MWNKIVKEVKEVKQESSVDVPMSITTESGIIDITKIQRIKIQKMRVRIDKPTGKYHYMPFSSSIGESVLLMERQQKKRSAISTNLIDKIVVPRNIVQVIAGKRIKRLMSAELPEIKKLYRESIPGGRVVMSDEYNTVTCLKTTSFGFNFILEELEKLAKDPGFPYNVKNRELLLNVILREIKRMCSTEESVNNVLHFTSPILPEDVGTRISLATMLANRGNLALIFFDYAINRFDEFRKFVIDNRLTIIIENINMGMVLPISYTTTEFRNGEITPMRLLLLLKRVDRNVAIGELPEDKDQDLTTNSDEESRIVDRATEDEISTSEAEEEKEISSAVKKANLSKETKEKIEEKQVAAKEKAEGRPLTPRERAAIAKQAEIEYGNRMIAVPIEVKEEIQEEVSDVDLYEEIKKDKVKELLYAHIDEIDGTETTEELMIKFEQEHDYSAMRARGNQNPKINALRKAIYKEDTPKEKLAKKEASIIDVKQKKPSSALTKDFSKTKDQYQSYKMKRHEEDLDTSMSNLAVSSSIPLLISSKSKEIISEPDNYLERRKYTLKDPERGEEVQIEFDVPILTDANRFYFGGNHMTILSQDVFKPVARVDEIVILTSAYNKIYLELKGKYSTKESSKVIDALHEFNAYYLEKTNHYRIGIKNEVTELDDTMFKCLVSYNLIQFARHISFITLDNGEKLEFLAGTKLDDFRTQLLNTKTWSISHDKINDTLIIYDDRTKEPQKVMPTLEGLMYLVAMHDEDQYLPKAVKKSKVSKSGINSVYGTIMGEKIPVILLMLLETPIKTLLEKLKVNGLKYSFVKSNVIDDIGEAKFRTSIKSNIIKLKNDTLVIDDIGNEINEILLNPLFNMKLDHYDKFNARDILSDQLATSNKIISIENFLDLFLADPFTLRLLDKMKLPNNLTDLFIYAAALFTSHETYRSGSVKNLVNISPQEIVNRVTYKVVSKAISDNNLRLKRGSRHRIIVSKEDIVNAIYDLPNIETTNVISPVKSIITDSQKSQKGTGGVNVEGAFSMDRRAFDPESIGGETMGTPYSGNAGVTKYKPFNPSIQSLDGEYQKAEFDANGNPVNTAEFLSFMESIIPYSKYDAPARQTMMNGQGNHIISIKNAKPKFASYGSDEMAAYMCEEFSKVAKEDATVLEVTEDYIKYKYSNDVVDIIRFNNTVRNSAKGYFIKNDFVLSKVFKKGDSIKKGTIIAYNDKFFKTRNGIPVLAIGTMSNILVQFGEATWEDAGTIFSDLSSDMSTNIVKRISLKVPLSAKIAIDKVFKLGDKIKSGECLFKYSLLTTENSAIADYYHGDEIFDLGLKEIKSKYNGKIVDFTIHYRESIKEELKLSKDMSKLFSYCNNSFPLNNLNNEPKLDPYTKATIGSGVRKLTYSKFSVINGQTIENGEALIEVFVEVPDAAGIGDKVVIAAQLKNVICAYHPAEKCPIGAESGRKVGYITNTSSVMARMTPSFILAGTLNAILIDTAVRFREMIGLELDPDFSYVTSRKSPRYKKPKVK